MIPSYKTDIIKSCIFHICNTCSVFVLLVIMQNWSYVYKLYS